MKDLTEIFNDNLNYEGIEEGAEVELALDQDGTNGLWCDLRGDLITDLREREEREVNEDDWSFDDAAFGRSPNINQFRKLVSFLTNNAQL